MVQLAEWMKEHGYSEERMAKEVGVNRATINRYKSGQRKPGVKALARIRQVTQGAVNDESFYPELRN